MSRYQSLTEMAADPASVTAIVQALVDAWDAYRETREVPFTDAFMAAHNIHKAMLLEVIEHGASDLEMRRALLIAARDTFAEMVERELKKAGN